MALPGFPQILLDLKEENKQREDSALEQIAHVAEQVRGLWNYAGEEAFDNYAPNLEQFREEARETEDFFEVWSTDLAAADPYGAFLAEMEQVMLSDEYGYDETLMAAEFMRDTVSDMVWKKANMDIYAVDFDEMHELLQQLHDKQTDIAE